MAANPPGRSGLLAREADRRAGRAATPPRFTGTSLTTEMVRVSPRVKRLAAT